MNTADPGCRLLVLISGNGSNLQAIIDQIEEGRLSARVVTVISNQPDAYGLQRAEKHGIPTTILPAMAGETREAYDERLIEVIEQYQPDWIIMAGFMRILSDGFVNRLLGRLINIHPSLLPDYKGLNTHQRVLEANESLHGASVHFVTPALDDGPVISQGLIQVRSDDTPDTLKQRVHKVEHCLYPEVIQLLCQQRVNFRKGRVLLDGKMIDTPLNRDFTETPSEQV